MAGQEGAKNDSYDIRDIQNDVAQLKSLYQQTLHMGGLKPEDKLKIYDSFFDELNAAARRVMQNGPHAMNAQDIPQALGAQAQNLDTMTRLVGMPDHIFPDMFAEFVGLKAQQIHNLLDRADHYALKDAVKDLKTQSVTNPSEQQIAMQMLDSKMMLYKEARDLRNKFQDFAKDRLFGDDDVGHRLDLRAGYDTNYVAQKIEITALEIEQRQAGFAHEDYEVPENEKYKVAEAAQAPAPDITEIRPQPAATLTKFTPIT